MTTLRINLAADINSFHEVACKHAGEDIDISMKAGRRLPEVLETFLGCAA